MRQLLRRPRFARYFLTVATARASGSMFGVSGVLLVFARTHSLTLAGLVVAGATLPGALTGPVLGAWLDVTASRRRLLLLDRLVTLAAIAALLVSAGHAPNWTLPLIGIAYGITSPLSSGAFASVMPEVAGARLLPAAYTLEATSINAAFILGPALAGVVAGAASPAYALELQIVIGAVLALLIAGDVTFELRPEHGEPPPRDLLRAVTEGLRSLWRIAPLRWNALTSVVYVCAWGTLNVGFPAFAVSVHAGAHAGGYLWAAISLGSMISAFAFRGQARRVTPRVLMACSFLAMALSVAAWPLAHTLASALALVTLTGLLEGPSLVALIAARQRLAPPQLRNQIVFTVSSLNLAAAALGAAAAGPLHAVAGTAVTLLAFATLIALAGVIALGTGPRDGTEREPSGPAG
jgi:MFS family permease